MIMKYPGLLNRAESSSSDIPVGAPVTPSNSRMRIRFKKRKHSVGRIIVVCLITLSAALVGAQVGPILRTFQSKNISAFRINLRIRTEIEGQKPSQIGAKTFLQPVSVWLEQNISWQTTRTITSIDADGSAEVEEKLSNFSASTTTSDESTQTKKLQAGLESALSNWIAPRTLRYRETQSGQISKLTAESVPPVDESSPRVLTAWLLRALRPTAALPARPLNLGEHWQEPRVVQFAEWTATTGSEAGEWLAPPAEVRQRGEPTIKLQTTQEITGTVTSGAEKPAEGSASAHFHAESLSTLALDDLHLMSASRSATRDILWTLAPVEGLEKPPQYRGRLFVEISIQVCDETPCVTPNSNSGSGSH
jgi:hypothetical protein